MDCTVEISLYALEDHYVNTVWEFIDSLKNYPDIEVVTNGLSTQIFGNYNTIMQLLTYKMADIFENHKAVFVLKVGKGILKI